MPTGAIAQGCGGALVAIRQGLGSVGPSLLLTLMLVEERHESALAGPAPLFRLSHTARAQTLALSLGPWVE